MITVGPFKDRNVNNLKGVAAPIPNLSVETIDLRGPTLDCARILHWWNCQPIDTITKHFSNLLPGRALVPFLSREGGMHE